MCVSLFLCVYIIYLSLCVYTHRVSASIMMEVNASHAILDNVWLWRADVQNGKRSRDCNHSLVVNGHAVTAYGLAAEHTQSDNTVRQVKLHTLVLLVYYLSSI